MIKPKKGSIASFLMENFGLVLGAIVIIALVLVSSALYNTLVDTSQGTRESFIDLASTITEMINTKGDLTGENAREQAYNMAHKFILAGFNRGGGGVRYSPPGRCGSEGCVLDRPALCGYDDACLCICETLDSDACVNSMMQCEKIKGANYFFAEQAGAKLCSFGLSYQNSHYLLFAGDMKTLLDRLGFLWNSQTCVFGIKTLRIEKTGADIHITIKD